MSKANETATAEVKKTIGAVQKAVNEAGGKEQLREVFGKAEIQLSKPFTWCGETYETVKLDFESLTGRDMEAIDEQIGQSRLRGLVPAYSRLYQRLLCARACDIPADGIERLPMADYNAMVTAAQNFLFVTG